MDKGFIYLSYHEGWYNKIEEMFIPDNQVSEVNSVKVVSESGHPVEWVKEENYKFKLSAFQDRLLAFYDENPDFVLPASRLQAARAYVLNGLHDISVSRLATRVSWGIPVPKDSSQSIYVWFDALINYLTTCKYPHSFPENSSFTQILGKDILIFHAMLYPALLMAAEISFPQKLLAHGHFTVNKVKMSKSLGNVIDPFLLLKDYGRDAVRYALLRDGGLEDTDFSPFSLETRYNSDLADTLGNLVKRTLLEKFLPDAMLSSPHLSSSDLEYLALISKGVERVKISYQNYEVNHAILQIMEILWDANKFYTVEKPWTLMENSSRRNTVLFVIADTIRICCILLQPVIPTSSARILDLLQVRQEYRVFAFAQVRKDPDFEKGSHKIIHNKHVLFPKKIHLNLPSKKEKTEKL